MASRRKRPPSAPTPTARKIRLPYPKDADGNPLCRWCRGPVRPPRKSWCSDACVEEYRDRYDNRHQRRMVQKRDRGVCAGCGLDTMALHRRIMDLKGNREAQATVLVASGFRLTDLRFKRRGLRPLWQADHTIPVIEGGGGVSWTALRTLCLICHREETRQLMIRRRAMRKAALHGS